MISSNLNTQEFNSIMRSHSPVLFATVIQLTRDKQTTEDIVQETFLRLWEKRMTLKNDNIGGWLYRVALHLAYKHLKKESCKNRIHASLQAGIQPVTNEVEDQFLQKENKKVLEGIYKRLPEQQQAVYLLSNMEGLSRNEIAAQLNLSPNTVRNHLTRAVRFIRDHVKYACIFLLFSGLNYIFFNATGTKPAPIDLFKVQEQYKRTEMDNRYPSGYPNTFSGICIPKLIPDKNI